MTKNPQPTTPATPATLTASPTGPSGSSEPRPLFGPGRRLGGKFKATKKNAPVPPAGKPATSPAPAPTPAATAPAADDAKRVPLDVAAIRPIIHTATNAAQITLVAILARWLGKSAGALALTPDEVNTATDAICTYLKELSDAGELFNPKTPFGRLMFALAVLYLPHGMLLAASLPMFGAPAEAGSPGDKMPADPVGGILAQMIPAETQKTETPQ